MVLNEGIVIKVMKHQETSKIITVLNNKELATYYVRGGAKFKSRNFSYSNELTKINYDFSEKTPGSLKILKSGSLINNYSKIKQSIEKLNDCYIILEIINQLGTHINDFETFYNFTSSVLDLLNDEDYSGFYLIIYKLKLLYLLGIGPEFKKCALCNTKENLSGFSISLGGMVCANCNTGNYDFINNEVLEVLKFLYYMKLENITKDHFDLIKVNQELINKIIDNYYEVFLGYKSRAKSIIKQMKT